jgi:hypothetical protein
MFFKLVQCINTFLHDKVIKQGLCVNLGVTTMTNEFNNYPRKICLGRFQLNASFLIITQKLSGISAF